MKFWYVQLVACLNHTNVHHLTLLVCTCVHVWTINNAQLPYMSLTMVSTVHRCLKLGLVCTEIVYLLINSSFLPSPPPASGTHQTNFCFSYWNVRVYTWAGWVMAYQPWEGPWRSCEFPVWSEETLGWSPHWWAGHAAACEGCWRARGPWERPCQQQWWQKNPALSSDPHTPEQEQTSRVSSVKRYLSSTPFQKLLRTKHPPHLDEDVLLQIFQGIFGYWVLENEISG